MNRGVLTVEERRHAARPGSNGHRGLPQQRLPPDAHVPGGGVQVAELLLVLVVTMEYLMATSRSTYVVVVYSVSSSWCVRAQLLLTPASSV